MAPAKWHEIGRPRTTDDPSLTSRAQSVLAAIENHKDFTLVEVRRAEFDSVLTDVLIVVCTCDGVPSKNRVGIEYKESLAIEVGGDPAVLPKVRAIRYDFPLTPHQNAVPDGAAAELCLYAQRPSAVLRTWTAPAFLRTIQWWLTETAHERLHQPDQPVEQLFFDSPNELILPARYLSIAENANRPLILTRVIERFASIDTEHQRPAFSLFLEQPGAKVHGSISIQFVPMSLPPITHGIVEREPSTLGSLHDQLQARGANIKETLLSHVKEYVGAGRDQEDQLKATILLLMAPIRRTRIEPVEGVQARAFWLDHNLLALGVAAGVVFRERKESGNRRYFVDHPLTETKAVDDWRALALSPLNVSMLPDLEAARRISGTPAPGPRAVLAGAGALGSALLDLWRRSGWGEWTVIDPDHVRPHNLIRHTVTGEFLGLSKALAVALRDAKVWQARDLEMGVVTGDASELSDPAVKATLEGAALIVDTTTTLEVPRRLAGANLAGRAVSAFLTPTGTDSVLIAEDQGRLHRIDSLEAQYWRAVLTQSWGETHLTLPTNKFRSGGSCRDVSVVMPYSAVLAHAATLAEQIQSLPTEGLIRIWQRDRKHGSVSAHDVPISEPILSSAPHLTIVWDSGTLDKVRALRRAALPAETGGVLIGYHDLTADRIYVVEALEAPSDSIGTPESFERGIKGLALRISDIARRSVGQVGYLGEWHSHPQGYDARESDQDVWQLLYLGDLLRSENLPALMFIVTQDDYQWLITKE